MMVTVTYLTNLNCIRDCVARQRARWRPEKSMMTDDSGFVVPPIRPKRKFSS